MEENEILRGSLAMEELIRAISKYHCAKTDEHRQELIEKIANVYIMLYHISIVCGISIEKDIEPALSKKIARLLEGFETDEHRQELIEEIANAYIMLYHISIMYDISGEKEIEPVFHEKITRLRERLEAEDNAENGNT